MQAINDAQCQPPAGLCCYNCNKVGHILPECPHPIKNPAQQVEPVGALQGRAQWGCGGKVVAGGASGGMVVACGACGPAGTCPTGTWWKGHCRWGQGRNGHSLWDQWRNGSCLWGQWWIGSCWWGQ
eukprot:3646927-Rhodomonas_salina.1